MMMNLLFKINFITYLLLSCVFYMTYNNYLSFHYLGYFFSFPCLGRFKLQYWCYLHWTRMCWRSCLRGIFAPTQSCLLQVLPTGLPYTNWYYSTSDRYCQLQVLPTGLPFKYWYYSTSAVFPTPGAPNRITL